MDWKMMWEKKNNRRENKYRRHIDVLRISIFTQQKSLYRPHRVIYVLPNANKYENKRQATRARVFKNRSDLNTNKRKQIGAGRIPQPL